MVCSDSYRSLMRVGSVLLIFSTSILFVFLVSQNFSQLIDSHAMKSFYTRRTLNMATRNLTVIAAKNKNGVLHLIHPIEDDTFTSEELLFIGSNGKEDIDEQMLQKNNTSNSSVRPITKHLLSDDIRYLHFIRSHISRPAQNKTHITGSQTEITMAVLNLLGNQRNGFYVECGAHDGYSGSHTLFFETSLNWTGLLIEANRRLYQQVLKRNRKAFVFGGCLSPIARPTVMRFKSAGAQGGLVDQLTKSLDSHISQYHSFESVDLVQCFPLADIMASLGVLFIDFLTLDVQGAEPAILRTIDFNRLRINVIAVEVYDDSITEKVRLTNKMIQFFQDTGLYDVGRRLNHDVIFIRKDLNATKVV